MLKRFLHRPQGLFWRRAVFQIHLWAGVILGLYFLVVSISGSALVFKREMMNDAPDLPDAHPPAQLATYSALIDAVQRSNPAGAPPSFALQSIDMRSRNRRVAILTFGRAGRQSVFYFDRYNGNRVAQAVLETNHPILLFLADLHDELLGGRPGAIANGLGGLSLALMCLSGLVLWWPGKRIWRRALTVNWAARWPRVNFDMHSAFGFWTLPFVTMWALTGAYFIFPDLVQRPLHLFQPAATARQSAWEPGRQWLPADVFLTKAAALFPDDQFAYMYVDIARPHGDIAVFLSRDPARPLTLQEDIVYFDPATADILRTDSSDRWSPVEKALMASYSIHFGDFGGATSKLIWLILSLTLPLLTVSGYLMWWNRVLKKKWKTYRSNSDPLRAARAR